MIGEKEAVEEEEEEEEEREEGVKEKSYKSDRGFAFRGGV